jgi:hypothetical protein
MTYPSRLSPSHYREIRKTHSVEYKSASRITPQLTFRPFGVIQMPLATFNGRDFYLTALTFRFPA